MELYKINNGETYIPKNEWSNKIKNGKLTYFVSGEGHHSTKKFEVVDADLEPKRDALYIGKTAKEYGQAVAAHLCEEAFGCCQMSAESWVPMFQYAYETAVENNIDPSQVALEVANNIRGFFGILDVIFLESRLAALDAEYEPSKCRYKGKENVSTKDYIEEKYGEPTVRLIEKLLE
jgi:hypothetical protein